MLDHSFGQDHSVGHSGVTWGLPVPVPAETRTRNQGYGYGFPRVGRVLAGLTGTRTRMGIEGGYRCWGFDGSVDRHR